MRAYAVEKIFSKTITLIWEWTIN